MGERRRISHNYRLYCLIVVMMTGMLVAPSPASASVLTRNADRLTYDADPPGDAKKGEGNTLRLDVATRKLASELFAKSATATDRGDNLRAPVDCDPTGSHKASCTWLSGSSRTQVTASLRDGDDSATLSGVVGRVFGGGGSDTLRMGSNTPFTDALYGDSGSDTLHGGPGEDYLNGECEPGAPCVPGNDLLDARDGRRDTVDCGPGTDSVLADAPGTDAIAADCELVNYPSEQGVKLARFPSAAVSFDFPYYVAAPPGDASRVFVVEGGGKIRLVKDGQLQATPFLDISGNVCFRTPEPCGGESGLLSIAFAPDYATSRLFYVFYTRDVPNPDDNHELVIEEFRRSAGNPDVADPPATYRREILVIPHPADHRHNSGQLQFGPDGLLYLSVGDGGSGQSANAQNIDTLLGKLLRIDPRGGTPYSIPSGNPFVGVTGRDEIYSYGLRNAWRFSFDRLTGDLAIGDVGAASWEEIDFMPRGTAAGANFGWSCFEGNAATGQCSTLPGNHAPPVLVYPNPDPGGAAVAGGFVVRDTALPSLLGRYLYADSFGALGDEIFSTVLSAGGAIDNRSTGLSADFVVSFGEDACGHIYVTEFGGPSVGFGGAVHRIEPVTGSFACQPQS